MRGNVAVNQNKIIMNFSAPPSDEDILTLAEGLMESLPDEILEHCEELSLQIEDFADEATQHAVNCDNPYELLALYRSGKEITPGVLRKVASDDDVLILYRRPILDLWCETHDDLAGLIRDVLIEELGRTFDFSEDDIAEMSHRHHQGMF